MRTTLTLDDDLAMMLKREAESSRRPFRDVVNDAIRRGLVASASPRPVIEVPVFDLGPTRMKTLGIFSPARTRTSRPFPEFAG